MEDLKAFLTERLPSAREGCHPAEGKIVHKWKTFKTVAKLSRIGRPNKFTSRSHCAVLRETAVNSRATSLTLLAC